MWRVRIAIKNVDFPPEWERQGFQSLRTIKFTWASGNCSSTPRKKGVAITRSPSQLGVRMTIRTAYSNREAWVGMAVQL